MPKLLLTAFALLTLLSQGFGQPPPPDTLWTRIYDIGNFEDCYSVIQTLDNGLVLVGKTNLTGNDEAFVLKTDFLGRFQWIRTYGGSASDVFESIVLMPDGGYALGGKTSSWGAGGPDMWLVRTDSLGNVLWQHTYGGPDWDWCYDMIHTTDGGFALGGFTNNFGAGYYENAWLVKTDSLGDMQWQSSFGGIYPDVCYSLKQTCDGGYILGGGYGIALPDNRDMYLVKVTAQGAVEWQRNYGGSGNDNVESLLQAPDGGYAMAGTTTSFGAGNYDMWLVKVNAEGNQQWQHTYGASGTDMCYCSLQSPDGGYLLGGMWAGHFCVVKTDSLGNFSWQRTVISPDGSRARSIYPSSDGDLALAGFYYSDEIGDDKYVYLVKLEGVRNAWISLQPQNPPITIPPAGGSFQFNLTVTNCGTISCRPEVWIMLQLPSGSWHGPVLGPIALTLPTGGSIERLRTQNIPGRAPGGTYVYRGYVGDYPTARWDSSNFTFEKLGAEGLGLGGGNYGWTNTGQSFDENDEVFILHNSSFIISSVSPNPFNATTVASFELRDASHVNLQVYDIAGRLVETLVDGWREAGHYDVSFDGSNLPSGIYLHRIEAGQYSARGKMLLLK